MQLLLDIGNTAIKYATVLGETLTEVGFVLHSDESFPTVLERLGAAQEVWIASVVKPVVRDKLCQFITQKLNIPIYHARSTAVSTPFAIKNGYQRPEELGVDRWLNLIGARSLYASPYCVISCGTAVTVDVVDATDHHRGGLIAPGLEAMIDTLIKHTAIKLPHRQAVLNTGSDINLGTTTAAAVRAGCLQSIIGLIDRSCTLLQQQYGSLPIILTGGNAPHLQPLLNHPVIQIPHLVLTGLMKYAQATHSAQ